MADNQPSPPCPTDVKILIIFLVVHLLIVLTQTWAFFDYDLMARNKLQEPRFLADEAVVQSNRAICAAHSIVILPLNLLAIVGLTSKQFYGVVSSWMMLGTAMFWPTNFVASRFTYSSAGIRHVELNGGDFSICLFVFIFACWASQRLYRSTELVGWWLSSLEMAEAKEGEKKDR
eukprot:CAMPEP_0176035654 /NCGR_PEP_ID=MMETSP0120_2-20121206/17644_1 /TAXON_ID=160619 /ORGANISM="Kryptoperidinium foliaceum, Strain CCMP 1326" /LENGTH=174 /DNA_ID=CAMNT_0017369021 /DNA_START=23 /DNA_END=547 /DNA_ORIENTATION=-